MSEVIEKVRKVRNDDGTVNEVREVQAEEPKQNVLARIITFIGGVLLVVLTLRFILVLLGANPNNAFADFIYSISYPFVAPFFGLFSYELEYGVSRLELSTIVAIAVYALVIYGLTRLVTINRPENQ